MSVWHVLYAALGCILLINVLHLLMPGVHHAQLVMLGFMQIHFAVSSPTVHVNHVRHVEWVPILNPLAAVQLIQFAAPVAYVVQGDTVILIVMEDMISCVFPVMLDPTSHPMETSNVLPVQWGLIVTCLEVRQWMIVSLALYVILDFIPFCHVPCIWMHFVYHATPIHTVLPMETLLVWPVLHAVPLLL